MPHLFKSDNYEYLTKSYRVIDGDTIQVELILYNSEFNLSSISLHPEEQKHIVDFGFKTYLSTSTLGITLTTVKNCRIIGVDAPEKNRPDSKEAGLLVSDVVKLWCEKYGVGKVVSYEKDAYPDRFIGDVFSYSNQTLSTYLLKHNLVKPYPQGKRPSWSKSELDKVCQTAENLLDNLHHVQPHSQS